MIFLGLEKIDNTKAAITITHFFPDQLPKEVLETGVLVEEVAEPENIQGKYSIGYYSYDTKSVFYEYKDIPLTETEILKKRIEEQESALIELAGMLGGGQ